MKKSQPHYLLLILVYCLNLLHARAQCTGCNITINSNAVSSYTVNTGQWLCISPGFTYTGLIVLNGGTLCNSGVITNIDFNSGTFNNYGRLCINYNDLIIDLNGKLKLNNYTGSKFIARKNFVVNSTNQDSLYLNIYEGASINVSNSFSLNIAKTKIDIGLAATTSSDNAFITAFNVNKDMVLNAPCEIKLSENGFINVNGDTYILESGSKKITNKGEVNLSGNLSILGSGQNSTTIQIDNYNEFSISGTFLISITGAQVNFNNLLTENTKTGISGDLYVSSPTFSLNNAGAFDVGKSINLTKGNITNSYNITVQSVNIDEGTLTNNGRVIINRDFNLTGSNAVLNNSGVIMIQNNLINYGTITAAKKSVCVTRNFTNANEYAYVNGSTDLLNENNSPDNSNYPRIIVNEISSNSGNLTGNLLFSDLSFSGNGEYRIDQLGETSSVGADVKFEHECSFELAVGYIYPPLEGKPRTYYCPGQNVTLSLNPYVPIVSGPYWSTNVGCAGTFVAVFNIPPYSQIPSFLLVNVQSSGTVNVSGTYFNGIQNCNFSIDYAINISNASISTPATPIYFGIGTNVQLTSNVVVGTMPYQFNWQPNIFFPAGSTNMVQNPFVMPQVSLTYTVNLIDAYGCTASNTLQVIAEPFALLDKNLNGEYYQLFNNQLLFKYDGQYDNTSLTYNIYDKTNTSVNSLAPLNISTAVSGDNRYVLDLSNTNLTNGPYVLEVVNEKNEKLYLRFIK